MGRNQFGTEEMDALSIINNIYPLSGSDLEQLTDLFEPILINKNEYVIEANKTARYIYFLKSGICKIFYHKEDKEVVLDFCFPGDPLFSLNSFTLSKPGYEDIQTLENSALYRIESHKLQELYSKYIAIANWGRQLAELATIRVEYRLMSKLFKTATESYDELLLRSPMLVNRIKLGHIASYLGISQVTLSRIRAKV